jgi:hypothetical protein
MSITYAKIRDTAGQLAINGEKASSVSRKHVTIQVDQVREGGSVRPVSSDTIVAFLSD